MTSSALNRVLLDRTRSTLQEVSEAFTLLGDRIANSDTKNHALMQDVAQSCAPAARRQQLYGLCDEIEMLLDEKITGWLRDSVRGEIELLVNSLGAIRTSATHYSQHVARYSGIAGSVRAITDLLASPLDVPKTYLGPTDYQKKREVITDDIGEAISRFGEALLAVIVALEGAISKHTGSLFRYRDCT